MSYGTGCACAACSARRAIDAEQGRKVVEIVNAAIAEMGDEEPKPQTADRITPMDKPTPQPESFDFDEAIRLVNVLLEERLCGATFRAKLVAQKLLHMLGDHSTCSLATCEEAMATATDVEKRVSKIMEGRICPHGKDLNWQPCDVCDH